jgi:hypothetical protein
MIRPNDPIEMLKETTVAYTVVLQGDQNKAEPMFRLGNF